MRLRFSLRLLFVAFTLLAVVPYLLVIRPTKMGERLVAAGERGDYEAVDALLHGDDWRTMSVGEITRRSEGEIDRVFVEMFPRDWADWCTGRRRLLLRIARHRDANGSHVEWTEDTDIVARATGLRISPLTIY